MNSGLPEKYILYADDDADDRETLCGLMPLANSDLEVITVNNGLELIQFLDQLPAFANSPCLIILDVNMPMWDGIQTLRALKSSDRYKPLPVIMFSTSTSRNDTDIALRLGALDFVTKPARQHEFENIIKRFVNFCYTHPLERK